MFIPSRVYYVYRELTVGKTCDSSVIETTTGVREV